MKWIIILTIWIGISQFLAMKWCRAHNEKIALVHIVCYLFTPIVLIVSLVRQFIHEDWR